MIDDTNVIDFPDDDYSTAKERVSFFMLFLCPLIVLMTTASYVEGASKITIGYGVICGIAFLLGGKIKFYKETLFFMLFILWSFTGFFIAASLPAIFMSFTSLIQLFALFFMVSSLCTNLVNIKCVLFSFLVGGCIVAYLSISSGEYKLAEFGGEKARTAGIVGNANAFAFLVDCLLIILLCFFHLTKSKILKGIILCPIPLCFRLIVSSGSRSGFLGFVVILGLWYCLFYFKLTFKKPLLALFVTVIMIGFGMYVVKNLAYTTLLKRFTVATRETSRVDLVKRGLRVAADRPVLGVGLGNFVFYSSYEQYAHNNYVELLADTGVLGAGLYYGIYACIISKLFKLRKQVTSPMFKMILIYILFDLLIRQNFGVTYSQKETYIFLAVAVGYLNNCSQDQSSLNTVQDDSSY